MQGKEYRKRNQRILPFLLAGILLGCVFCLAVLPAWRGKGNAPEQSGTEDIPPPEEEKDGMSAQIPEQPVSDEAVVQIPDGARAVKILCGDYLGSGVIWSVEADTLVILSTAHLLMFGETAEIFFADGSRGTAEVAHLSDRIDVGFATMRTEGFTEQQLALWGQTVPYPGDTPVYATNVWLVASDTGAGQTIVGGCVEGQRFVPDMNNEMLILEMTIESGMSGSPVYDSEEYLLGIAAAGKEGETLAVPVSQIVDEYDNAWDRQ